MTVGMRKTEELRLEARLISSIQSRTAPSSAHLNVRIPVPIRRAGQRVPSRPGETEGGKRDV
jgi:hypothetical protein